LANNCCQYFVVEFNGDIYSCDFFVEKNLLLGNIADTTWERALSSPTYREFGGQKSRLNPHCQDCPFLNLCMGDCQKYRVNNGAQTPGISHLCAGWHHFFNHTKEPFEALENMLRNNKITGPKDQDFSV